MCEQVGFLSLLLSLRFFSLCWNALSSFYVMVFVYFLLYFVGRNLFFSNEGQKELIQMGGDLRRNLEEYKEEKL